MVKNEKKYQINQNHFKKYRKRNISFNINGVTKVSKDCTFFKI